MFSFYLEVEFFNNKAQKFQLSTVQDKEGEEGGVTFAPMRRVQLSFNNTTENPLELPESCLRRDTADCLFVYI